MTKLDLDPAPDLDPLQLLDAANAIYARLRRKPGLPPPVVARLMRAADVLVAAIDALYEATAPLPPVIGGYDADRCGVCGRLHVLHAGNCPRHKEGEPARIVAQRERQRRWDEGHPPHPVAETASNLPATVDQAEIARRELAGGVPTREWAEPVAMEGGYEVVGPVILMDGTRVVYDGGAAANGRGPSDG